MNKLAAFALLTAAACQEPAPDRQPTPSEMLAAHYETDEDFAPKSSDEWVAWANSMLPPISKTTMHGSRYKGDVLLLNMQDTGREIDRALVFKKANPGEWADYKTRPHYVRTLFAVKNYTASEDVFTERLRLTNNATWSMAEGARLFRLFRAFLAADA